VTLSAVYGVQSLLMSAIVWCGKPLSAIAVEFPKHMLRRLEEIDADEDGINQWIAHFS